jgi:hypothetical protein
VVTAVVVNWNILSLLFFVILPVYLLLFYYFIN